VTTAWVADSDTLTSATARVGLRGRTHGSALSSSSLPLKKTFVPDSRMRLAGTPSRSPESRSVTRDAAVPSQKYSSRPVDWVRAVKKKPCGITARQASRPQAGALRRMSEASTPKSRSSSSVVPAVVPLLAHSSRPWLPSSASKYSLPLTTTSCRGPLAGSHELAGGGDAGLEVVGEEEVLDERDRRPVRLVEVEPRRRVATCEEASVPNGVFSATAASPPVHSVVTWTAVPGVRRSSELPLVPPRRRRAGPLRDVEGGAEHGQVAHDTRFDELAAGEGSTTRGSSRSRGADRPSR
jgi:hypothetical protein